MPRISLTQFINYFVRSGTEKATALRRIRKQFEDRENEEHGPFDPYKELRELILEFHNHDNGVRFLNKKIKNRKFTSYKGGEWRQRDFPQC